MSDIGPFPGYFLDDKQYHSRARSVGVYNPMTNCTYSHLRIVRMPSPVQSIVMLTTPLQTGSTVLSGQWDTHNRRRTSNTTSPCRLLHIPVVLNDFHSRETTLLAMSNSLATSVIFFALLRSFQ
ncbi:hypothetical protein TNCV_4247721 [Trichonephila clavipes]|nr:hypothetical protein TNCV_4247721 [Trichonephila clavipes]